MAVIDNLNTSLAAFKVNDVLSKFVNCAGTYNTADILNGGETYDVETSTKKILTYEFKISGLKDHTIKRVLLKSLLLTSTNELASEKNFTFDINGVKATEKLAASITERKVIPTIVAFSETEETNLLDFTLTVTNNSSESCYYGLQGITIELSDINYSVQITFYGPNSDRSIATIAIQNVLLKIDGVDVSFTKDSSIDYNELDNIEGRIYFRKDGIYVDGYLYGTVAPATESKSGIVKLKTLLDLDDDNNFIIASENGIAAAPEFVINVLNNLTDLVSNEIITPADTERYGVTILQDTFETFTDEETGETGIIAPDAGIAAASTLMVYNAIGTLKAYADSLPAPYIEVDREVIPELPEEDEETSEEQQEEPEPIIETKIEKITDNYTFSKDFTMDADRKIYINWLEL